MTEKPTRKTPTPEKVRRRLIERWEIIRRNPDYRRAYRERDLATVAKFGIDADPDDREPLELFDLLEATHTDYSIDTKQVISGVLPLYETPWQDHEGKEQWREKREAVFVLDPAVTLEEIREGIERALKFRRRYWVKARRLIGPAPLHPVRLVDPNKAEDPEADPVREMLKRRGAPIAPVLFVDPLQPLGQMRKEIHALLKKWGESRVGPRHRWRRTTVRDIQAFDFTVKALTGSGKRLGRTTLARNLGCSVDQARRAIERARRGIAPLEDAALVEHLLCCERCQASPPCPAFGPLADRAARITRWSRERPASQLLERHSGGEVIDKARCPFRCPICHKTVRSQADAQKKHRPCAETILEKLNPST